MKAIIKPSKLNGAIQAPPSKSYAHRMLIGAALAGGESRLSGISQSEDMLATLDCIKALGADYRIDGTEVSISGVFAENLEEKLREKLKEKKESDDSIDSDTSQENGLPIFPCRESGSTLRFFIPIALAVGGGGVFTGAERLIERGVGVYEELFEGCGICVEKSTKCISVRGKLSAGHYKIRGDISSQFVTGMLFALSLLEEDSVIEVLPPVESRSYIDITIDVMKQFGVIVDEQEPNVFLVKGGQHYQSGNYQVEGDWSNAAFLYAFKTLGNDIEIEGLKEESVQGDRVCRELFAQLLGKRIVSMQAPQFGGAQDILSDEQVDMEEKDILSIDISNTPDLGPILFAVSAALRGGYFTGTKRLRIKESDRALAMAEELEKFGVKCLVGENEVIVLHSMLRKPNVPLNGHNDHRIVMALSVLASITGGEIEGAEAIRKSWPDFFEIMKLRGLNAEFRKS